MIAVDGRKCWTLFDLGARNTYVTPSVAELLKTSPTPRTIRTALGGAVNETNTEAFLHAEIEGHRVSTHALVIKDIGKDEDGKPIGNPVWRAGNATVGNQTRACRRETRPITLPRGVRGILRAPDLPIRSGSVDEVFAMHGAFDAHDYLIFEKVGGRWRQVFEGIGDAC